MSHYAIAALEGSGGRNVVQMSESRPDLSVRALCLFVSHKMHGRSVSSAGGRSPHCGAPPDNNNFLNGGPGIWKMERL